MKKDWEIKKLGEVTQICLGLTHTPKYQETGIPFISVKDISSGNLSFDNTKRIAKEEYDSMPWGAKPKKGDVLFCRVGTIGIPQIVKTDVEFGIFVSVGFFRTYKILFNEYLKYWLYSDNFFYQVEKNVVGSTIKNLNTGWLKNFTLPLPPLEEQKRIVKILDEKFAQLETIKTNAQTNLQNAKDLFRSQLAKVFSNTTWKKKRLGDSSELITKGSSPKWQGINYVTDDGILFVTSENVRENYIDLEKSKYLEKKFNDKQKRSILKKNDVLVNIVGASIGRAAIFDFDIVDANINQAVALIRSKNEIDVHFLSYFLNSDNAMNQYNNAKKDTARANLSLEDINNLRIPLPPLPEQKRIVKELDTLSEKVRQLQEVYTKQIANCDELKQAYLQKAFEGEL